MSTWKSLTEEQGQLINEYCARHYDIHTDCRTCKLRFICESESPDSDGWERKMFLKLLEISEK